MKALMNVCIVSAILAFPATASAGADVSQKVPAKMNCPMMGDAGAMQKDMGAMIKDMSAMMSSTIDPSMKDRMQKMHDQMKAMMSNMQKVGGGMMHRGRKSGDAPTTPPAPTEEDHKAHHPE